MVEIGVIALTIMATSGWCLYLDNKSKKTAKTAGKAKKRMPCTGCVNYKKDKGAHFYDLKIEKTPKGKRTTA